MDFVITVSIVLHVLLAVIWVGGMLFAYMVLRPAVDEMEPPHKLSLLAAIFRRFFVWVWHAVVILPATGYIMLFMVYGGFAGGGIHLHLMQGLGLGMIALFIFMFFGPYPPLRKAVAETNWPGTARPPPRPRPRLPPPLVVGRVT
nr:CopD family protein [Alphaproteobacteria bacterium]